MKKITFLLLFISIFCMVKAQKVASKKAITPEQKTTIAAAVNSIVGSYKISRIANEYFDSDTIPNTDSIDAKMTRLTIADRVAQGETLTLVDSTKIEKMTKNDTKFAFSFAYEFKANKTYVFSYVDSDKPSEIKGVYNYNVATGLITIIYPKKASVIMKYNKENKTLQNVVKKKEDAATLIIFSKVENKKTS